MYIYCVIVCVFLIDSFDYSQTCSGIKYLICDFFCCDLSILKRGTTKGKVNYSSAQLRGTYIHTYAHRYSEIAIKWTINELCLDFSAPRGEASAVWFIKIFMYISMYICIWVCLFKRNQKTLNYKYNYARCLIKCLLATKKIYSCILKTTVSLKLLDTLARILKEIIY